jgi:hypothetical protein
MKGEWEKAIKPQFRNPQNNSKEYIVGIPAEAFKKAKLDDTTKEPLIKDGRIHFKRFTAGRDNPFTLLRSNCAY